MMRLLRWCGARITVSPRYLGQLPHSDASDVLITVSWDETLKVWDPWVSFSASSKGSARLRPARTTVKLYLGPSPGNAVVVDAMSRGRNSVVVYHREHGRNANEC